MNCVLIAQIAVIVRFGMTVIAPESKVTAEADTILESVPDSKLAYDVGDEFMSPVIGSGE